MKRNRVDIEEFTKQLKELSPISMMLIQNSAEILLARDRLEQKKKVGARQEHQLV